MENSLETFHYSGENDAFLLFWWHNFYLLFNILFCSTIYSFVTKSRRDVPDVLSMLWVCQYAPDLSAYVPMYVESKRLSKAWITGSALVRTNFFRNISSQILLVFFVIILIFNTMCEQAYNGDSAWWNFCVAGNYVSQFYSFAIKAIRDMQQSLQLQFNQDVKEVEARVKELLADAEDSSTESNFIDKLI
jgi:dipeptidase